MVFATGLAGAAAFVFSACVRSAAESVHADEVEPAATYRAGHGLKLSPEGAQFVGLATAEVGVRDLGVRRGVAAVPASAALRTIKGDFVFVANGEWFLRTPVVLGATSGDWLEVVDGLYEGDEVVTGGAEALWLAEIHAVNGGVGCADGH